MEKPNLILKLILVVNCVQTVVCSSRNYSCNVNYSERLAANCPNLQNNSATIDDASVKSNRSIDSFCNFNDEEHFLNRESAEKEHFSIANNFIKKYFDSTDTFSTNVTGLSELCKKSIEIYNAELKKMNIWALRMYDSSAKIPSGLLNGNVNQYGDYDQCLRIRSDRNNIKGKYCLASFQISLRENTSGEMRRVYDLIHSHHAFRSEMTDPGHRIPRFSSITWGICMPSTCSASDLQMILEDKVSTYMNTSSIGVKLLIDTKMCQESTEWNISTGTKLSMLFFAIVCLIVVYSTLHDIESISNPNKIVASFSLKRTFANLTSLKRSDDDIKAVHGIRFINALMLIISHKSMAVFFHPYMNRTEMAEELGDYRSMIGRAASLYTDPFIMFSGLLTCYSILGKIDRNKNVSVMKEYISRFSRLIPTLTALILFCTWILPLMGSGPQWPLVIDHHSDICKQYWWRNFLFIHNYFGFENMCLTHTHHLGIDTQLFIVGVPLMVLMGSNKKYTKNILTLLLFFATVSTFARFYVSYTMNLANYVHFGASVQQLFRTANYMYILPSHRFTVYAMGIFLALLLRYSPSQKLTKNQLKIGWILATLSICAAFFGPSSMSRMGYEYNSFHNALYAAFGPIGWCASFAWIVYTMHHGYSSYIGNLLSWKGFLVWTRLSYAVYLTQFPVFFYNVGRIRTTGHFEFLGALLNSGELIWIMLLSVLMTLVFDLPFQKLKNIYLSHK